MSKFACVSVCVKKNGLDWMICVRVQNVEIKWREREPSVDMPAVATNTMIHYCIFQIIVFVYKSGIKKYERTKSI
jgi:hypothetical protein